MGLSDALNIRGDNVLFIVNSQAHPSRAGDAESVKRDIELQAESLHEPIPEVILTHNSHEIHHHGAWTYFPIVQALREEMLKDVEWVLVMEDSTGINLGNLLRLLSNRDSSKESFLGYGLKDKEHVIIHHFDPPNLVYPLSPLGFALSKPLVSSLRVGLSKDEDRNEAFPNNFNIDAPYEFAKYVKATSGVTLAHEELFCLQSKEECATFMRQTFEDQAVDDTTIERLAKETLFAIKTCKKFHASRLPIIHQTWAPAALNLKLFSEISDPEWHTVSLPGVVNTERGHCKKSQEILRHFHQEAKSHGWKWLVLADDDTILGVSKVLQILANYDPDDVIQLGQRYGFKVASGEYGFDYITGGGGMVFSLAAVIKIFEDESRCTCPKDDHPDDMHLGACFANAGLHLIHSHKFHQGRPEDYPDDLLLIQDPVSFHKFWNNKPLEIYQHYFRQDDQSLKRLKEQQQQIHHEEL